MKERSAGIRELRSKLSEYLRDVKHGATIIVTEHGRRVARMVPESGTLNERLDALRGAGAILWSGRKFTPAKPEVSLRGKKTVAEIVVENRE